MAATDSAFTCPNCGAAVAPTAPACPDCGADEKTGWSAATIYDGTGIEDLDEFDSGDWQRREGIAKPRWTGWQIICWVVAVLLLGLFGWLLWL